MMAVVQRSYSVEDTQNIPPLLRNLRVHEEDEDRESMTNGIRACLRHGVGEPSRKKYRFLDTRKETLRKCHFNQETSNHLAECGFFLDTNGRLTCYQCASWLHLQEGEDPIIVHSDLFPNCQHIRRLHGKRPRPVSVLGNLPQRPLTPSGARRRLFSE